MLISDKFLFAKSRIKLRSTEFSATVDFSSVPWLLVSDVPLLGAPLPLLDAPLLGAPLPLLDAPLLGVESDDPLLCPEVDVPLLCVELGIVGSAVGLDCDDDVLCA